MWIHLLSLGLIDGAGGEAPPVPDNADTHDGYFHNLWRKMAEKAIIQPTVEEVLEYVQEEPAQAAVMVREVAPRALPPSVPIEAIKANLALQRTMAEKLMTAIKLRQLDLQMALEEDEVDAILLLT